MRYPRTYILMKPIGDCPDFQYVVSQFDSNPDSVPCVSV